MHLATGWPCSVPRSMASSPATGEALGDVFHNGGVKSPPFPTAAAVINETGSGAHISPITYEE